MKVDFESLIIYEDNHLLVINKPAGLLSQADHTKDVDVTVLAKAYLKDKYVKEGNVYLGLVHRLDRMTEGILVLAKTSKCASRLSEAIKEHQWDKTYLAVVHGKIEQGQKLTDWLLNEEANKKVAVVKAGTGQKCELWFEVLAIFNDKTLIKVHLLTGRHHQIRVQLAHFGHPLVGDCLYGNPKERGDLMLACTNISFKHPTKDEMVNLSCLPKSSKWKKYLKDLKL